VYVALDLSIRPKGYLNASLAVTSCAVLQSVQTWEVHTAGFCNTSVG